MHRNATGHYSSSLAVGETVRTFVPDPLLFGAGFGFVHRVAICQV